MAKTPNTRSRPETRIIGLPVQKVCGIYKGPKFSHSLRREPSRRKFLFLHSIVIFPFCNPKG